MRECNKTHFLRFAPRGEKGNRERLKQPAEVLPGNLIAWRHFTSPPNINLLPKQNHEAAAAQA